MIDMKQRVSLVDYLGEKMGCLYLSDLRQPERRLWLHEIILECPADDFPLRDWLDALQYLTPLSPSACMTSETVRTQLLDFLKSPQNI